MRALQAGLGLGVIIALALWTFNQPRGSEGFAGYGFGSGDLFIQQDMADQGYTPISHEGSALWYEAALEGYPVQLGYFFHDDGLIGGAWVIEDTSNEAYRNVSAFLGGLYEQVNVGAFRGPDAMITHTLNRDEGTHAVTYQEIR